MTTLCITGHRTEKIKNEESVRSVIELVFAERRFDRIIVGLANGVDLWAGFEAIRQGIDVVSAKPWAGHTARKEDRELYDYVVSKSVDIVNVNNSDKYPGPWVYQKRNEWMVDNSERVFAVWDGTDGGTKNCFDYAQKREKYILHYQPNTNNFAVWHGLEMIKNSEK